MTNPTTFKNLQDVFFATQNIFYHCLDIPYELLPSHVNMFKQGHDEMAKKIVEMQKNGASMEFILGWAEHTISEVSSYCKNNNANFDLILVLLKNRTALNFFGTYQDVYQPILDKMQLEQDLSTQTTASKALVSKI